MNFIVDNFSIERLELLGAVMMTDNDMIKEIKSQIQSTSCVFGLDKPIKPKNLL